VYCIAAASSPLAPPELLQEHVAEPDVRCVHFYCIHESFHMVIHWHLTLFRLALLAAWELPFDFRIITLMQTDAETFV
jgi:hypothetical protein